jgi:DNA processing protein
MIGVGTAGPIGGEMALDPSASARPEAATTLFAMPHERGAWSAIDPARFDAIDERPFWIALSLVPGIGPVGFARLLLRYGSARGAWSSGPELLAELPRLPDDAAPALARLRRSSVEAIAARIEAATHAAGGRIITALEAGYPPSLATVDPRPPVLYLAGDVESLNAPCVAVVGTRRASAYGRSCAAEIADELGRAGVTVVSGLAMGIDREAHTAAIEAGGRTVAVLPSPLDRIYPPRHRELARRMKASGGALVSELAPGHAPGRPDFARRNRIIAGLARAVVVVEAPDRSGALLTAAAAMDYGRELFAVPGPIDAVASRGCNRLIADHMATLVTSAASLLQRIGASPGERQVSVLNLSDAEALVLGNLLRRAASIEELMGRTRLETGPLASALTLLEARGLVESYGGATFHATLAARRIGRSGGLASG